MARAKRRSKKFFISVDFNGAYPDAKQKSLVEGFCDEALEEFKLLVGSAKVAIVLSADLDDVTLLEDLGFRRNTMADDLIHRGAN